MANNKNIQQDIARTLAPVSRRRFLKWGLWGTAGVLAVAGGAFSFLRRSARDDLPLPAGISSLSRQEYQLFLRLAQALLPVAGHTGFPAVEKLPTLQNIDRLLAGMTPSVRKDFGMGLSLLDNAAVLKHGKRLVDLDDEGVRSYMTSWISSGVFVQRALAYAASKIVYTGYFQDSASWAALEYDGPVSRRWGIPMQGNSPLPE